MSLSRLFASTFGGAVLGGGLSASAGAAAGVTGAAVMTAAGHAGYVASEAVKMGAIGGGVLGAGIGAVSGALFYCGLFGNSNKQATEGFTSSAISYVGGTVLSGLAGYGIMNSAAGATAMKLAETAAAFAVGGAITMIPASCALVCICVPLVIAAGACLKNNEEATSSNEVAMFRV